MNSSQKSQMKNKRQLSEDMEDLGAFEARKTEKIISYKALLKSLNSNPRRLPNNHRSTS